MSIAIINEVAKQSKLFINFKLVRVDADGGGDGGLENCRQLSSLAVACSASRG
jgi:hypothetical protein